MLPPWPGWDGLHPLVIHFPIALLIVAPLFIALALLLQKHTTGFGLSALVLLVLGTTAAFVAVSTGQAAAELSERSEAINAVLMRHEELAERTRDIFAGVTLVYLAVLVLPVFSRRFASRTFRVAGSLVVIVLALAGCLQLAAAAHQGGMLVHQLGVHALVPQAPATPPAQTDDEDDTP